MQIAMAGEVAQRLERLATKSEDFSLILGSHMVKGKLSFGFHMYAMRINIK